MFCTTFEMVVVYPLDRLKTIIIKSLIFAFFVFSGTPLTLYQLSSMFDKNLGTSYIKITNFTLLTAYQSASKNLFKHLFDRRQSDAYHLYNR